MTPQIKSSYRITAIVVTVFLIVVCCFVSLRYFRKPVQLPRAPISVQSYVARHLLARSAVVLSGSGLFRNDNNSIHGQNTLNILNWSDGRTNGISSTLTQHYTSILEGNDNVDGVECRSVRLKPNLKLRPWIQFWIDSKTGHICSTREWSAENKRKPVGIRVNNTKASSYVVINPVTENRILQNLPEGYHLIGSIRGKKESIAGFEPTGCFSQNPAIRHYVYSDGLQVVSMFVGQMSLFPRLQRNVVFEQGNTRIYASENNGCMTLCLADLPVSVLTQWANEFITRQQP